MSNAKSTLPADEANSPEMSGSPDGHSMVETVARDRYVIGEEIAQGGIGRILRANDKRLERQVALKELLDPSPEYEARFLREALVTARLQHPAIVPVYDVGRLPNGEIFYAMKLVNGRSLGEVVDETDTFDKRLALLPHVLAVAEAIAYAHSEQIVHRDLKPANVLIGPFGETVVIDWGIAKDLRETETTRIATPIANSVAPPDSIGSLTMAGAVLGTPGYMPPEQAGGEAVDERADVYALGAILYHVLAGVAPYEGTSGLDIITKVLTEPPRPLSTRERGVPRDLLAVVTKAMARNPSDRYRTANEFARDLRLFQTGQIVGAYNYSWPERILRFVLRHRAVVATMVLGLAITSVIAFTSLSHVFDARQVAEVERDRANEERLRAQEKQSEAETARKKATQQTDELILLEARAAARRDPNAAIGWLASLSDEFHRWGEARLIAADAQEYGIATILDAHTAALNMVIYSPDGAIIATASDDRTVGLWKADGTLTHKLVGHTDEVWRVVFTPDSKRVMSSSKDGTARIWDVASGKNVQTFRGGGPETEWAEFIGDDQHVALIDCTTKRVEIHDAFSDKFESLPGEIDCPGSLHVSTDAKSLLSAADGNLRVTELATGKFHDYTNKDGQCLFVYATTDGKYVACSGMGGYASLWETKTGRVRESVAASNIPGFGAARFAPDNRHFLFSKQSVLRILDLETGAIQALNEHKGPIFAAFFSPDGHQVVTTSFDHTTIVFDLDNQSQQPHFGFRDTTSWADFSPDQRSLVVASWDHTARIFPLGRTRNRIVAKGASPMSTVQFSANETELVSVQENVTIRVDSIENTPKPARSIRLEGEAHTLSRDGNRIAFATKDGSILIHEISTDANVVRLAGHASRPLLLQFSSNGKRLLTIDADDSVHLWDITSREDRLLYTAKEKVTTVAFSEDDNRVAIGENGGVVRVFSILAGSEQTLEGHVGRVEALTFLPDNARLVSGGRDHTLRIWDLATGNVRTIDASGLGIVQILVSSDGTTLYTLGRESSIRRWNAETGAELGILRGHHSIVIRIALSPEGKRLLSVAGDGEIRLWDLATGQSRQFEGHRGVVTEVTFAPQGNKFASVGLDGTVRLWYDDLPFDGGELRAWMSKLVPTFMDLAPVAD
jgi:WD40 repeat protein/serine/threonine protein kinase